MRRRPYPGIDLCEEAIRLGRILVDESLPGESRKSKGLLALMLLHRTRVIPRRVDPDGASLSLEEQDRPPLESRAMIAEGWLDAWSAAEARRAGASTRLQAAIVACMPRSQSFGRPIGRRSRCFMGFFDESCANNPVFELNRIVAISYDEGPEPALGPT